MDTKLLLQPKVEEHPLFQISKEGKTLLEVDNDGVVKVFIKGELKEIESDKELAIGFCCAISNLCGIEYSNQKDLTAKMIKLLREKEIDKIL